MIVKGEENVALVTRNARAVDTQDRKLHGTYFADAAISDCGDTGSWRGAGDPFAFVGDAHGGVGPPRHDQPEAAL